MSKHKPNPQPVATTDAQVAAQPKSCKADHILASLPGTIKGYFSSLLTGERKLEFHLPISSRELTEEELLAQEQAKVQKELERRAKKASPTPQVKPKSLNDMTDEELKTYQANIHRELESRKKH